MKFLILALVITTNGFAANNGSKRILPVTEKQKIVKKNDVKDPKVKALLEDEDCDEKAKKPVEIKPESISLTGNAGCTLDEAH